MGGYGGLKPATPVRPAQIPLRPKPFAAMAQVGHPCQNNLTMWMPT